MAARFGNKVVVVTGGGSGIGEAMCRAFASEGAAVAVTDLRGGHAATVGDEIRESGGRAAAWELDVTDQDNVEQVADEVQEELGPIYAWINNAGVSVVSPFLEMTRETWDSVIGVNLRGTYFGCQAAIRRMLPREKGVVLNMSSQSGKVGNSHYAAYCAGKFGIIGLTQSLAQEFAEHGIRVNALCPGVVFTPLWESQLGDYARKRNMRPEEVRPYLEERIPLRRLGTPEDVAVMAVFLAGDGASYITGQAINICGGSVMD